MFGISMVALMVHVYTAKSFIPLEIGRKWVRQLQIGFDTAVAGDMTSILHRDIQDVKDVDTYLGRLIDIAESCERIGQASDASQLYHRALDVLRKSNATPGANGGYW